MASCIHGGSDGGCDEARDELHAFKSATGWGGPDAPFPTREAFMDAVETGGVAVMDLMFELNREVGTTLVLVTHDEQIALRCAHRVRIQAGRIVR